MIERHIPASFLRAKEIAAKVRSPVGKPFAAAKKGTTAELYLYDAIGKDPWTGEGTDAKDVIAALKEAEGADSLEIHVNSPGGYVFEGIAIYNAIRAFKGQKTVYVDGVAASIASIIALAGDRVVTNEGAMWMVHDPAGGIFAFGTADEIEDDARKTVNALRKVRETLLDVYVSATGKPLAEISAWMTAETWMTAAEAKERGFTDEVASPDAPDEEDEPMSRKHAAAVAAPPSMNADDRAEMARIRRRDLSNRFAGASPGPSGQPGTPSTKISGGSK